MFKLLSSNRLRAFWSNLIGDETIFSMESRIFNAISIFAVVVASINAVVNMALGLIIYGVLMVPLIAVLILGYFQSRYRNRLNLAVGLTAISSNLLCGATYFSSAGSSGVNLFTFILIVFILTLVSSKKKFWIWVPLNLSVIIALVVLEYLNPNWVEPLYTSPQHKLLDLAQTLFEVLIMIILITLFMKKSYNREKHLAHFRLVALEETNETKNKLFSIVSHDLKAPLASIENYLSLLNEVDLSPEERVSIEKSLLVSTRQTSEMLQNILSWSKDQMDGITTNLIAVQIHETLKHTVKLQNSLAKQKNIQLNYVPNHTINVIADPDMLQLIVRNLLNNAIKFSTEGSTINLSIAEQADQCVIIISDTGIGITEDKKSEIFSLKSNGTYGTNNEKGIGLGLSLAKSYVELQHGKIWFESELEQGTTFYVSLPKA